MYAFESKMVVAGKWLWRAVVACGQPTPPSFQSNNFNIVLQAGRLFSQKIFEIYLGSQAGTKIFKIVDTLVVECVGMLW